MGHQRWRDRGNSSLCAIYNLESIWVHSVARSWNSAITGSGSGFRCSLPLFLKIFLPSRVLRLCFLGQLRICVHLIPAKAEALWRFQGYDLGAVHAVATQLLRWIGSLGSAYFTCLRHKVISLLKGGRRQNGGFQSLLEPIGFNRILTVIISF